MMPFTAGYCVKCKKNVEVEGHHVTFRNGSNALQGKCPTCNTTVTRIVKKTA